MSDNSANHKSNLITTKVQDNVEDQKDAKQRKQEFDVLKIIDDSKLESKELIKEILAAFVQTRKIYEMLQLSNYSPESRNLIL